MSDSSKVICPACVHEFRAVPVDVQEELEALRKDAERYRWLRNEDGALDSFTAAYFNTSTAEELDAAIDAARDVGDA